MDPVDELRPPDRLLMGPGPSETHPRVLRAFGTPPVGHLDPAFIDVMDDTQRLLRSTFRTDNRWTIPVSGTGSAAMEAAIANLVEPGDTAVVPSNGYFGDRMAEMVRRAGGTAEPVDAPWGEPLDPADVRTACAEYDPDVVGVVHAETSTGVLQPSMPAIADAVHDHDALLLVDCVTSLGGVEFRADEWDVDAAYAGAQKCLSCPPGASPLTVGEAAAAKIRNRETPVRSWYLDLSELDAYWGEDRSYHHTAPINNVYGLREALRLVDEEGIETRWARHERYGEALGEGLWALGLEPVVDAGARLPSLTTARLPAGLDPGTVVERMRDAYDVEIATGLGTFANEAVRVGCMGHGARRGPVLETLGALGETLVDFGVDVDPGAGVAAAVTSLREE
ncbi:pyridoxal-phosphate-dependent aminotransferase family protein [Natronomonas marina]|jgi:alanine-glyoxylate transaminase/serine-glyoxylate transaminase/serine-pyruvate transaminase|uniref:pyridoxal-phosphate-dependent aminotransferase family protein n=1 Tax=Natronomonas marina TaxID=2961939 RepID=UPI0020CA2539|nr:alanine--glyoxylate aminotransferase family protein [Natronomonas marina]